MGVRVPDHLKIILESMAYQECKTLSYIVKQLLETHPRVVRMAEKLYAIGMENAPAGKD